MTRSSVKDIKGDRAKVILHGLPGSSKTTTAGSMSDIGKMLYLYVPGEEGINSLRGLPKEADIDLERVESLSQIEDIYEELLAGGHGYQTVAWDSITALQACVVKGLLNVAWEGETPGYPGRGYDFWGEYGNFGLDFPTKWFALASHERKNPVNVVMVAHTAMMEVDGETKLRPDLDQKRWLSPFCRASDFIFFLSSKGEDELLGGGDDEGEGGQTFTMRIKASEAIDAKIHVPLEKSMSTPAVLKPSDRVKRLTLPIVLKALGVTTT